MKTNLLRLFTFAFAVSSIAALIAPSVPAYADQASDEAAMKLILACKNIQGPTIPGSDCDRYRTCMGNDQTPVCESVRNLNGSAPAGNNQFITGCQDTGKQREECINAMATCYARQVVDGKVEAARATECNTLIQQGKIAEANQLTNPNAPAPKSTCVVEGIGWLLCPVLGFMSKIVDASYSFVSALLNVQPLLTTGETKAIYDAWAVMRNFANVAFVIAFLVIIFSQLTSVGVSNYGIKKLLPKIIIAAILVNVSYWICAIAVDLSNILGISINGLFKSVGAQMNLAEGGIAASGNVWTDLVTGILAGSAVTATLLHIGLSALVPALITAALAILTILIVLTVRQALIIILVIVAPLAFVAYLLPNTESWFNKWRGLFTTLLLMFPIIGGLFGGAALASQVIMASATGDLKIAIQIMGALAAIAPIPVAFILIKSASGFLGKVGAFVNNPNRGPVDRLRKRAGAYRDRRQNINNARRLNGQSAFSGVGNKIRGDGSSRFRRAAAFTAVGAAEKFGTGRAVANLTREQKNAAAEQASKQAAQSYVANRVANESKDGESAYAQKIAGPTGDVSKVTAAAIAAQVREFNDAVNAEKATMSKTAASNPAGSPPGTPQSLADIVKDTTATEARRAAAAGQLMKTGGDNDIHNLLDYLGTQPKDAQGRFTDSSMQSIQQQVAADMGSRKPTSLGAGDMSTLNTGTYNGDFASKIEKRLAAGKFSAESLANTSADELDKILGHISANGARLRSDPTTLKAMQELEKDIAAFRTNPQLQGKQPAHEIASRMEDIHAAL